MLGTLQGDGDRESQHLARTRTRALGMEDNASGENPFAFPCAK